MTRRPSLDETERAARPEQDAPPDTLGYYARRERWEELGREIGKLRTKAKAAGVPLESLPGAAAKVAAFRALGRELDRRAR